MPAIAPAERLRECAGGKVEEVGDAEDVVKGSVLPPALNVLLKLLVVAIFVRPVMLAPVVVIERLAALAPVGFEDDIKVGVA